MIDDVFDSLQSIVCHLNFDSSCSTSSESLLPFNVPFIKLVRIGSF